MIIKHVEEYHEFELKTMPLVAKMLFPCMPDSVMGEEGNDRNGVHPISKKNVGNCGLRRVWLARRSFIAMEEIHMMVFHSEKLLSDRAEEYIISKFKNYLHRHGGWQNLGHDAAYECMEDMRSMTFLQAVKGFLSGHVLKCCIDMRCSIDDAAEFVANNIVVKDCFPFEPCMPDVSNAIVGLSGITNVVGSKCNDFNYKLGEKKYAKSHILQNVWKEMKNVSYAWAAAVDVFDDASTFTHRMIEFARPFEIHNKDTSRRVCYTDFASKAKEYYTQATSRRQSTKRSFPPLIKGRRPDKSAAEAIRELKRSLNIDPLPTPKTLPPPPFLFD